MSDSISRQAAIDALIEWYGCEPSDLDYFKEIVEKLPSADKPQGEWIEVSTLREILGDVQYAHRGNSEAEAVIADVWDEVKDALKGVDDEVDNNVFHMRFPHSDNSRA